MTLSERFEFIKRDLNSVELLAVSKGQDISKISELYRMGQRKFGENYLQELQRKADALKEECPDLEWHFIGHIQSKKMKKILEYADVIQSIDREELLPQLEKNPKPFYLQVNIDSSGSKGGFLPEEVVSSANKMSKRLHVYFMGLMCIPDPCEKEELREKFSKMRMLMQEIHFGPQKLSMGMSSDYQIAIEEGSSLVRVGTALFGERRKKEA